MKFYIEDDNNLGKIFTIETQDNRLQIYYGENLDLYFVVDNENPLIITKEIYPVYKVFNSLFYNLENGLIFAEGINNLESIEDYKARLNNYKLLAQELKLYKDGVITFKSDEVRDIFLKNADDKRNELKLLKVDDKIILKVNLDLEKYPYSRSIRFRMSGSYYEPLVYLFAKLYKELEEIDIENYQIYMEEYMFLFVKHLANIR